MAQAQQGFEYEKNAARFLKRYDIVPQSFSPAGAAYDQPDLLIQKPDKRGTKPAGAELKISLASAGSLVMKWENGVWGFNPIDKNDVEKTFLRDLATNTGALSEINRSWRSKPAKFSKAAGVMSKKAMYEWDLKHFRDVKSQIPTTNIERYYGRKNTHYINIGTHGFFLLGPNDPLDLNKEAEPKVPRFSRNATAMYRARVQYKGNDNYQFTFELQFQGVQKSPYNIAPVSRDSVNIIKSQVNLDCFL